MADPIDIRGPRASSVIVHQVPAASVDQFLTWERGITGAAEASPGYQATDVYPPGGRSQGGEWVVVIHFDKAESLQRWIDSPERKAWTERLPREIRDFRVKTLPSGFGSWFADMVEQPKESLPPGWKMVLTVLLGLYPLVMLLTIFVGPHTSRYGMAVGMLISNLLSVAILQWLLMPVLTRVTGPWLHATLKERPLLQSGGLALLLLVLAGTTIVFQRVTG